MRQGLVLLVLVAGPTAAAPGQAPRQRGADLRREVAQLVDRLTPEARRQLGVPPDALHPEGYELARVLLKPLSERGPLSPEEVAASTGAGLPRNRALADEVMRHRVSLLGGYPPQDLGDPIDWFRAPAEDWQWPTHLSRHYWLLPAAYVYRATGRPEYAEKVVSVLLDWVVRFPLGVDTLQNRPAGPGRRTTEGTFKGYVDGPWTSLSAHARVDTWTLLFQLLWDAPAMSNGAVAVLLNSLFEDHLQLMLEYPRAMNQFQGIAASLIGLGLYYPGIEASAEAERVGWERMVRYAEREIYPDGSLAECSPNYGGGCVVRLYRLVLAAEKRGRRVPPLLRQRTALAARYLAFISDPAGRSPRMAKGGDDIRGLLRAINAERDPEVDFVASGGTEGRRPGARFHLFRWAGHAVMRSGWDPLATWLFFEAGPRGSGHHDLAQLSFQLISNGEWLLTDPGYYTYSTSGEPGRFAAYLQSTAAHNTALVDGLGQVAVPPGTSRGPNTQPGDYFWEEKPDRVTVEGAYTYGYGEGGSVKVVHRRRLSFYPVQDEVVVADTFEGDGAHRVDLHWQLDPAATVNVEGNGARVKRERTRMTITVECDRPVTMALRKGEKEPLAGWFSSGYGNLQPAPMLKVSVEGVLPLKVVSRMRVERLSQ
ncbi:MAG: alginate lyase family protein [Armatimonadota bacterium]|nr:alginate lyase family protein [Armatimonadota bacterium]